MLPAQTDVLIVGAGPTGLALAIALHQAGVDHLLIDRLAGPEHLARRGHPRPHARDAGAARRRPTRWSRTGCSSTRFTIRDRDRALLQLALRRAAVGAPLHADAAAGRDRGRAGRALAALGGSVHRGVTAVAVDPGRQSAPGSTLTTPTASRSPPATSSARDGMHSVVRAGRRHRVRGRRLRGIVRARRRAHGVAAGPQRGVAVLLARTAWWWWRRCRTAATASSPTLDDAPETPGVADMQALLDARGPRNGADAGRRRWSGARASACTTAWPKPTAPAACCSMGDAAHVHSPAGGQGMNTGIVDAVVLGRLLAEVVARRAARRLARPLRRPAPAGGRAGAGARRPADRHGHDPRRPARRRCATPSSARRRPAAGAPPGGDEPLRPRPRGPRPARSLTRARQRDRAPPASRLNPFLTSALPAWAGRPRGSGRTSPLTPSDPGAM